MPSSRVLDLSLQILCTYQYQSIIKFYKGYYTTRIMETPAKKVYVLQDNKYILKQLSSANTQASQVHADSSQRLQDSALSISNSADNQLRPRLFSEMTVPPPALSLAANESLPSPYFRDQVKNNNLQPRTRQPRIRTQTLFDSAQLREPVNTKTLERFPTFSRYKNRVYEEHSRDGSIIHTQGKLYQSQIQASHHFKTEHTVDTIDTSQVKRVSAERMRTENMVSDVRRWAKQIQQIQCAVSEDEMGEIQDNGETRLPVRHYRSKTQRFMEQTRLPHEDKKDFIIRQRDQLIGFLSARLNTLEDRNRNLEKIRNISKAQFSKVSLEAQQAKLQMQRKISEQSNRIQQLQRQVIASKQTLRSNYQDSQQRDNNNRQEENDQTAESARVEQDYERQNRILRDELQHLQSSNMQKIVEIQRLKKMCELLQNRKTLEERLDSSQRIRQLEDVIKEKDIIIRDLQTKNMSQLVSFQEKMYKKDLEQFEKRERDAENNRMSNQIFIRKIQDLYQNLRKKEMRETQLERRNKELESRNRMLVEQINQRFQLMEKISRNYHEQEITYESPRINESIRINLQKVFDSKNSKNNTESRETSPRAEYFNQNSQPKASVNLNQPFSQDSSKPEYRDANMPEQGQIERLRKENNQLQARIEMLQNNNHESNLQEQQSHRFTFKGKDRCSDSLDECEDLLGGKLMMTSPKSQQQKRYSQKIEQIELEEKGQTPARHSQHIREEERTQSQQEQQQVQVQQPESPSNNSSDEIYSKLDPVYLQIQTIMLLIFTLISKCR